MVEKIIINPNKVRGYGNIMSPHSSSDYEVYMSSISSGTDTVNGQTMTVYELEDTILFFDKGTTTSHNDNWNYTSGNIQITRGDTYTTISETATTSAQYRANNNVAFTDDFIVEWDNHFTPNNSNYFLFTGTSDSAFRMDLQGITENSHIKLEVTNLTLNVYVDETLYVTRTISNRDADNGLKFRFQLNNDANDLKYSNFKIYR